MAGAVGRELGEQVLAPMQMEARVSGMAGFVVAIGLPRAASARARKGERK